jgi:uncharacterized protein (TIGR01244 family)
MLRPMRQTTLAVLVATTVAAGLPAQSLVGKRTIQSVPSVTLLETTDMFLQRYAKVGDDLFIAGQPTQKALRDMKAQGVTTVINLRMPEEMAQIGFDEKKLIDELGMKYVHIPMRGGEGDMSYSPATLAKFTSAMKSAEGRVLLHCTVAWRASHIWAAYLIQEGLPEADVLQHARGINLMDDHRMDDSGKQPIEMFLGRRLSGLKRP